MLAAAEEESRETEKTRGKRRQHCHRETALKRDKRRMPTCCLDPEEGSLKELEIRREGNGSQRGGQEEEAVPSHCLAGVTGRTRRGLSGGNTGSPQHRAGDGHRLPAILCQLLRECAFF